MERRAYPPVLAALVCAAASWSCVGDIGGDGRAIDAPTAKSQAGPCGTATAEDTAIFEGLQPHCAGCHQDEPRAFFRSIETFVTAVVANPKYVVPGDPDGSYLVQLLEGKGGKQMPLSQPYAELVAAGKATLTMGEVRDWIKKLQVHAVSTTPSPDAPRVRRISAYQIQRTLYQQLGLGDADFFVSQEQGSGVGPIFVAKDENLLGIQPPDAVPAPSGDAGPRFIALGGGTALGQQAEDGTVSPGLAQGLTQTSQAWCRIAIEKPSNVALFPNGDDPGAADEPAVKATIGRWAVHFLGQPFSNEEIASLYGELYEPLATAGDATLGRVGLCAYFIRHPLWVLY